MAVLSSVDFLRADVPSLYLCKCLRCHELPSIMASGRDDPCRRTVDDSYVQGILAVQDEHASIDSKQPTTRFFLP